MAPLDLTLLLQFLQLNLLSFSFPLLTIKELPHPHKILGDTKLETNPSNAQEDNYIKIGNMNMNTHR